MLSSASRTALETAAGLASTHSSKLTIVFVDEEGRKLDGQRLTRVQGYVRHTAGGVPRGLPQALAPLPCRHVPRAFSTAGLLQLCTSMYAKPPIRRTCLCRELRNLGIQEFECLEEEIEANVGKGSVAVGDVADQVQADLVVMSTEAVHAKHVDANLLAEFVPCPVLLLP